MAGNRLEEEQQNLNFLKDKTLYVKLNKKMFNYWANFWMVYTMDINALSIYSCKNVLRNIFTSIRQRVRELKKQKTCARTHTQGLYVIHLHLH